MTQKTRKDIFRIIRGIQFIYLETTHVISFLFRLLHIIDRQDCDQNTTYTVAVAGLLAEAAKLLEVVEFAKQNFSQKAIMVRYLGQSEIL